MNSASALNRIEFELPIDEALRNRRVHRLVDALAKPARSRIGLPVVIACKRPQSAPRLRRATAAQISFEPGIVAIAGRTAARMSSSDAAAVSDGPEGELVARHAAIA